MQNQIVVDAMLPEHDEVLVAPVCHALHLLVGVVIYSGFTHDNAPRYAAHKSFSHFHLKDVASLKEDQTSEDFSESCDVRTAIGDKSFVTRWFLQSYSASSFALLCLPRSCHASLL